MRPSPHSTFPHYSISKMASASQENINLQVAQGRQQENSDNNSANRPPPAKIARERWSDSNKNKYKSRGASDVKNITNVELLMHGSIPAVTIPPRAIPPGFVFFCKNVVNSPPPGL